MKKVEWLPDVEYHDYKAAESYLTLIFGEQIAREAAQDLCNLTALGEFKAKDIFRACGEHLLQTNNSHVRRNLDKIHTKTALSPILLVTRNGKLVVADGYHRLCAVYSYDEDAVIPVKHLVI